MDIDPAHVYETAEQELSLREIEDRWGLTRTTARRLRAMAEGVRLGPRPERPVDVLVVGDQHVTPGAPTEHFAWLAELVRARRPDVVVNVGDVIDNVSFSFHAGPAEKARYNYMEELDAAITAWRPVVEACREVGARMVLCLGNHDDHRLKRVLATTPWLRGAIKELGPMMEAAGWVVYDYQQPAYAAGIAFAHNWVSGAMGKPIGGVNVARSMALKIMDSALGGHSHVYAVKTTTTPLGRKVLTGTVGCFIHDQSDVSDWAGPQVTTQYDRGVVYLHCAANGHADVEWVSMDRLKAEYA